MKETESEETPLNQSKSCFGSKHQKHRLKKKLCNIFPNSPTRRRKAELIESLARSPKTSKALAKKGVLISEEESNDNKINKQIVDNLKSSFKILKSQSAGTMNENVRYAYRTGIKLVTIGCKQQRSLRKVSKKLDIRPAIVSSVVKSFEASPEPSAWINVSRSSKCNKLTDEAKAVIKKFWHENSRPTGDKRDIVRQRKGVKEYNEHPKQLLEKTQTEIYLDFCNSGTNIKCSQRRFEAERPFNVKPATRADRNSCMCRKHVEIHKVFKDFMRLRKSVSEEFTSENELPMYTRLTEMIEETLCKRNDEDKYHDLKCIKRECEICGVFKIKFSDYELREDG